MKNKIILCIVLSLIFSIKLSAVDSWHGAIGSSATDQVCVFCHVQHAANSASSIGPL